MLKNTKLKPKNTHPRNFKNGILEALRETRLNVNFNNLSYLPRWTVLLMDIAAVCSAGLLTYSMLVGMKLQYIHQGYLMYGSVLLLVVNILFFWVFKTYSGIIRHSSYIDGVKIFFAQFAAIVALAFLNFLFLWKHDFKLFLNTGLFINTVLSFSFLFFYRIIVKQTFERYVNVSKSNGRIKALIFGFDANAIAVANALRSENPQRFKLLGFVDRLNRNASKRILDLPIMK